MEFTKTQIAGLVLGYLKSKKCFSSIVDDFIDVCPYLKPYKNNKYFISRVNGMSLVEILEEYANVFSIIETRIESSNYFRVVKRKRTTLVDHLLYLLDTKNDTLGNSTPICETRESTPMHDVPDDNCTDDSDVSTPRTPKRRTSRTKSAEIDEAFDVSEVLTQTLLENHELHEKIAETINIVRNTPEASKTDEHISAGASKELDAIIKTVVQRTEEDPLYNRLLDEIIGTAPVDDKQPTRKSGNAHEPPQSDKIDGSDTIDDHNNDAVRSIIEVSQKPPSLTTTAAVTVTTTTLSNGGANAVAQNPLYINTGGLIVVPPESSTSKQFYIVNNQPLINMNVSTVKGIITDNDIMSMPTIIVNDETHANITNQNYAVASTATVAPKNPPKRALKKIVPKLVGKAEATLGKAEATLGEFLNINPAPPQVTPKVKKKNCKTNRDDLINSLPKMSAEPSTVVVTASKTTPSVVPVSTPTTKNPAPAPKATTHVRNLDFSTPQSRPKAWDADLRTLAGVASRRSPTPKRKKPASARAKKGKTKSKLEEKGKEEEVKIDEVSDEVVVVVVEEEEKKGEEPLLATPTKDMIPKTPGGGEEVNTSFHCTPFNEVLEEQLRGVDLTALPTPKIPITPGFAITPGLSLTPAEMPPYNNRSTDYSTSSSYYQPSDTEQNKSVEQLIEECKKLESRESPPPDKFTNLKILSDVVIEQGTFSPEKCAEKRKCDEYLKKFNNNVIGKKNLSLLSKPESSSSSDSDSSDSESEKEEDHSNKTVICNKEDVEKSETVKISDIISSVEVKDMLDEETRRKNILSHLEVVRQRTIKKIKEQPEVKEKKPRNTKKTEGRVAKKKEVKTKRKSSRKKDKKQDENTDEEAQNLVKGLAQRGIHLVHKKAPHKNKKKAEVSKPKETIKEDKVKDDTSIITFEKKVTDDCISIVYEENENKEKILKSYNLDVLKKNFEITVFAEHLNEEVTRTISCTSFSVLLDISPKITCLSPNKNKKDEEDELMDYVFIGSVKETSPETKTSKGGRKRKSRLSEDEKQVEKKSKNYENDIKLLKKIDVDVFLDKVHGE